MTGDVRGSVTRGTGDRGPRGAGVQPIQVAAASDRRRARQRDTGHGGSGPRGAGVRPIQAADASDRQRGKQRDTGLGGCRLREAGYMVQKVLGWGLS